MEEVFLNFGTCAVTVINDGITFKGTPQTMWKALKITYWCIARGNYKGNSVKKIHQFLNETQTITGGHRGTHAGFIQDAKTSQHAWNSAPIDDTYISWILAEIGREFIFTLDVDICDYHLCIHLITLPYSSNFGMFLQNLNLLHQFSSLSGGQTYVTPRIP